MNKLPMGTIMAYALSTTNIPDGWLLCDGQVVPPKYQELATQMKYTPNLCGRTLIGTGNSYSLHHIGGKETHQLTVEEMPKHNHSYTVVSAMTNQNTPINNTPGMDVHVKPAVTGPSGNNEHHNNMQPYYVVNYIIYTGS